MIKKEIFNLIKETSTNIPEDVLEALIQAKNRESKNSSWKLAISTILENIKMAKNLSSPICQDTGFPNFFIKANHENKKEIENAIFEWVKKATKEWILRPNAVNSITWENSWNNIWEDFPKINFEDSPIDNVKTDKNVKVDNTEIQLLLKWWWSENVSEQISLPANLEDFWKAWRDFEWVKKAVLQVVKNAKWKWCAPWILSIHIWWDRALWWEKAKKWFLKKIWTENKDEKIKKLEQEILKEANDLWIWPMWFWWKTTILDCRISSSHRLPASFFVTVWYMCWASRSWKIVLDKDWNLIENSFNKKILNEKLEIPKDVKTINFPISEKEIRKLKIWDMVFCNWTIFTWRDSLHVYAMKNDLWKDLSGSAIYHCWPVVIQEKWKWKITAGWPTTSIREEPYQADFIKKTWIRAVIWKWWMWEKTSNALKENWAVYLHAIWWAATYYADSIKEVKSVKFLEEFWTPEALWELKIEWFLAIVTMDSFWKSF